MVRARSSPGDTQGWTDHQRAGLSWREAGSGQPIVFLHGLGGARMAWGPQLRGLADRFRCVAWDMPGYGHTAPIRPLSYNRIAGRVVDLIDELGLEQADLVGLSFGGMQALHTAIDFPARVGKLVLASTSPAFGMDGTTKEQWTEDRLAPLDSGASPADGAERILDAIAGHPLTGRIRAEAIECFHNISADGFRASVECLPSNDVRAKLGDIHHQALVIVGQLDRETPPSYARVLHDDLPDSRLEVLSDVGHLTNAEAPDRFNQLLADFLGREP